MQTIAVSHKIRLVPSPRQEEYFRKACGTARFAYNWGLAQWQEQYQKGEKPSAFALKKLFRQVAKTDYPWVAEVTKCAAEQAFNDLAAAYRNFFRKTGKYPTFKKKGRSKDSFYLSNDKFSLNSRKVRIPKLGWVKMREELRYPEGRILAARVSRTADQWYIAIQVEILKPAETSKNHAAIGVDLGINAFAFLSDGRYVLAPKPLRKAQRRLRRLQRRHARKKKGSNNRRKSAMKISRMHMRIVNIRQDFLHKLTHQLAGQYQLVAIEDLHVKGMIRNHRLALSISDAGFGEFRRQLEYKSNWYGSYVFVADRFFPSSKTCSQCGQIADAMPLNKRSYECDCGNNADRDHNAAVNLMLTATGGSPGSYACGQTRLWDLAASAATA